MHIFFRFGKLFSFGKLLAYYYFQSSFVKQRKLKCNIDTTFYEYDLYLLNKLRHRKINKIITELLN